MTLTLYRVNTAGQNINNLDPNNLIAFNATTDVNTHNAFITEYRAASTIGIGNNQAAEQDLGDHQDLGAIEFLYVLNGFISKRNQAIADDNFITIMKKWDEENKTNTNFFHGRFGIQIEDFPNYDLAPIGTGDTQIGLIWKGIDWNPLDYQKNPLRADFQIQLIVDKGDGT